MKTMHWLGVVATSLLTASALMGCSGDDAPPAGTAGTSSTGAAGSGTAGSGTAGSAGSAAGGSGAGGTGSAMGVQLQSPAYHTVLSAADAPAGAEAPAVYKSAACASCHGDHAEGKGSIGPEIRFSPAAYAKAVVRGGRTTPNGGLSLMAAFAPANISDADLDAVIAWTNSLPKPTTGEGLYKAMCGNCHGPMTPTGGSAPITIQGATTANVDKFVRMGSGTDYADRKKYMPAYDTTVLTDAELSLIKTYIAAK